MAEISSVSHACGSETEECQEVEVVTQYDDHSYTLQVGEHEVEVDGSAFAVQEEGNVIEVQINENGEVIGVIENSDGDSHISNALKRSISNASAENKRQRMESVDLPRTHEELPNQAEMEVMLFNIMQQKRVEPTPLSPTLVKLVRDLPTEDVPYNVTHEDLMRVLTMEDKISVRIMRRVLPALRIVTYFRPVEFQGKKKIKGLWHRRPDDWPSYIPHKDPNNGEKHGDGQPSVPKANCQDLKLMYKHLKDRFSTMLEHQAELLSADEIQEIEMTIDMDEVRQNLLYKGNTAQNRKGMMGMNGAEMSQHLPTGAGQPLPTFLLSMTDEDDQLRCSGTQQQQQVKMALPHIQPAPARHSSPKRQDGVSIAPGLMEIKTLSSHQPQFFIVPGQDNRVLVTDDKRYASSAIEKETAQSLLRLSSGGMSVPASPPFSAYDIKREPAEPKVLTPLTNVTPLTLYLNSSAGGGFSLGPSTTPSASSTPLRQQYAPRTPTVVVPSPVSHATSQANSFIARGLSQMFSAGGTPSLRSPPVVSVPMTSSYAREGAGPSPMVIAPEAQDNSKGIVEMRRNVLDDLHTRLKDKIMVLMSMTLGDTEVSNKLSLLYKDIRDLHAAAKNGFHYQKFIEIAHDSHCLLDLQMLSGSSFQRDSFIKKCDEILQKIDHIEKSVSTSSTYTVGYVHSPEPPSLDSQVYQISSTVLSPPSSLGLGAEFQALNVSAPPTNSLENLGIRRHASDDSIATDIVQLVEQRAVAETRDTHHKVIVVGQSPDGVLKLKIPQLFGDQIITVNRDKCKDKIDIQDDFELPGDMELLMKDVEALEEEIRTDMLSKMKDKLKDDIEQMVIAEIVGKFKHLQEVQEHDLLSLKDLELVKVTPEEAADIQSFITEQVLELGDNMEPQQIERSPQNMETEPARQQQLCITSASTSPVVTLSSTQNHINLPAHTYVSSPTLSNSLVSAVHPVDSALPIDVIDLDYTDIGGTEEVTDEDQHLPTTVLEIADWDDNGPSYKRKKLY